MTDVSQRMIDRNGHRFGAALSAAGLLIAYIADWRPVAPVMTAVFAIGVIFGLRYSPMGATYRALKKTFKLNVPVSPEEEAPPRFAQTMGLIFMAIGTLGFYSLGWGAGAWIPILMVVALQALLGVTGICVGCEMYLIGKRMTTKAG